MIRTAPFYRTAAAALTFGFVLAGCTSMGSSSTAYTARLSGASEVPPTTSAGTGTFDALLDKNTKTLSWTLTYTGLTGPATAAHLHGAALPGVNAPVVVPFPSASSGSTGSVTLTDAQIADLAAGKWYANVHTAKSPAGEIRGQVMAK